MHNVLHTTSLIIFDEDLLNMSWVKIRRTWIWPPIFMVHAFLHILYTLSEQAAFLWLAAILSKVHQVKLAVQEINFQMMYNL